MNIKITWEVNDGYIGKARPQTTEFDTDDFMDESEWNELSDDEKREHIESFVQEDFDQKISYEITNWGI